MHAIQILLKTAPNLLHTKIKIFEILKLFWHARGILTENNIILARLATEELFFFLIFKNPDILQFY